MAGSETVNPEKRGTKSALRYHATPDGGESVEIRLRLAPEPHDVTKTWSAAVRKRAREADEFYATLAPAATADEALVMRQAFAGMLWSKQFYNYDVTRWLDDDPTQPQPAPSRRSGRNSRWRHVYNRDVISMPDKWEYPWYAAWDLAFHCVTLAHVDPDFAGLLLVWG